MGLLFKEWFHYPSHKLKVLSAVRSFHAKKTVGAKFPFDPGGKEYQAFIRTGYHIIGARCEFTKAIFFYFGMIEKISETERPFPGDSPVFTVKKVPPGIFGAMVGGPYYSHNKARGQEINRFIQDFEFWLWTQISHKIIRVISLPGFTTILTASQPA
jgi:hypothetical protein